MCDEVKAKDFFDNFEKKVIKIYEGLSYELSVQFDKTQREIQSLMSYDEFFMKYIDGKKFDLEKIPDDYCSTVIKKIMEQDTQLLQSIRDESDADLLSKTPEEHFASSSRELTEEQKAEFVMYYNQAKERAEARNKLKKEETTHIEQAQHESKKEEEKERGVKKTSSYRKPTLKSLSMMIFLLFCVAFISSKIM